MYYPLFDLEELSKTSDDELVSRLEKLRHRHINFGRHDSNMGHQLQIMMDTIQDQLDYRQFERQKKNRPINNEPINIE